MSVTPCRLTPSWPARWRLMSSAARKPPSCASERDVAEDRIAAHLGDQLLRPLRHLGGVGRRSACTGIANGSTGSRSARPAPAGSRRSCRGPSISSASAARSPRMTPSRRWPSGFSVITRRPTLVVGLTEPEPITETTPTTSGSALMMPETAPGCRCISANETSGARPRSPP